MLQTSHIFYTIDSHTMGEPTRIVTGGTPRIIGKSMMEKKNYMIHHLDWIRKLLMNEPRGHRDMFGAIITEPVNEECELGIIFMDSHGYLNMCGHGTVGAVTVAVNLGLVQKKEVLKVDTPAGVVECKISYKDNCVSSVTFTNVPSFVFKEDAKIQVEELGEVSLDIAFGGSIFGIVDADQFSLQLTSSEAEKIIYLGKKILKAANEQLSFQHPLKKEINRIDLIEFSLKKSDDHRYYRNTVYFGNGQLDRSPCGTGTCAKMAVLFQKGLIQKNEEFIHESIINSKFTGKILDTTFVGKHKAIIPQITGSAWITGIHQFMIDQDDPYKEGFMLA